MTIPPQRIADAVHPLWAASPFPDLPAPIEDWDQAYDNRGAVPGVEGIMACWERDAPAFRAEMTAAGRARLDRAYGDGERERWDLFLPEGEAKGLAVFIHGGYWMKFGKECWSHLAGGPVARGWACAIPSYPLAPAARVSTITRSIARFMDHAAACVPGPIAVSGHSAGGHLAARMLCTDTPLPAHVRARIVRTVSISGVHDLRPLLRTRMNKVLKLTEAEAAAESPALLRPAPGAALLSWVGGDELPEFIRQSALLANVWTGLGASAAAAAAPGRNHFDVIEGLADPAAALTEAYLGGL